MNTTTTVGYYDSTSPEAKITVKKNRLKEHGGTIYMEDGTEFEIELFNPKTIKVLTKIKINGNFISSGGLVLKPGQRIFLERFLETNKKFLYATYEVDATNKAAMDAIINNGDIEIHFYDEIISNGYWYVNNYSFRNSNDYYWDTNYPFISDNKQLFNANNFNLFDTNNLLSTPTNSVSTKIETGSIECGSDSNQSFSEVDFKFHSFHNKFIKFKILPISTEPLTYKPVKQYCINCGTKLNNKWKFCSNCGGKAN